MTATAPAVTAGPRLTHVDALDGIRGIAVAIVVVHHVIVRDPAPAFLGGWVAVDMFFALSGFLITLSILQRPHMRTFFRRRFWRLAPVMGVFLLTYGLFAIGAHDADQRQEWLFAAATQWANVQGAIGPPFSPHLGHMWSLSAEVQFYVVWGIALILLLRSRAPRPAIFGIVLALFVASWAERIALWEGGTPWNRLYLGPDTHSAGIVAGCAVGLAYGWGWLRGRRVLAILSVPAAALLAYEIVELSFLDGRTYRWGITGAGVAAAVVVAATAMGSPSPLRPLLAFAPVVALGKISYSLYLWHLPIIEEVARRNDGEIVRIAAIAIPLSLAAGTVSYLLVERPFMRGLPRRRAG